MSGWDNMFGRDSSFMTAGLGNKPSADITTRGLMTPEQKKALDDLLLQMGASPEKYTEQITAPQNNLQAQSLSAMEQAAMNQVAPGNSTGVSTKALTDVINAKPQDLTDYFKTTIQDPAMQMFQQQVMPELTRRFSGISGYGSDRMLQEALATGNTMSGVASAMGSASQQALESQQKNKIAAALGLPGISSANIDQLMKLQEGGRLARVEGQAGMTSAYNEFIRQQRAEEERRKAIIDAAKIHGQENIAIVQPGTTGGVQSFLGGFGQGFGSSLGGM